MLKSITKFLSTLFDAPALQLLAVIVIICASDESTPPIIGFILFMVAFKLLEMANAKRNP